MPTPLVSDALWETHCAAAPTRASQTQGRSAAGARSRCPDGHPVRAPHRTPWEYLPQELGCGSGITSWRRLREWERAGVWHRLHLRLLDRLGQADQIDWSRASLDGSSVPAGGPDTLLRLLRLIARAVPTPRVLGVDDLALRRRRRRYGTLLINLETHRPVDLLDERTADVLATWLRQHPGVQVLVRDRAEGGRQGAPDAVQVADRFHLVANASAALDEVLRGRKRRVDYVVVAAEPDPTPSVVPALPSLPLSRTKQRELEAQTRRTARWQTIRERHAAGVSIRRIAREPGMSHMTVRHLLNTPEPPRNRPPERPRPGGLSSPSLQPFRGYLEARWQDGCSNIAQLYREVTALGYLGSRSLLYNVLVPWRGPRPPPDPITGRRRRGRPPRVKRFNVRWLCLRPPEQLDGDEREALQRALEEDERLALGYDPLQRFRRLVARHSIPDLDQWLEDAAASGLAPFASLARGIQADRAAVNAGLALLWSTGPVEGHVTQVKLLKRQAYGRAKTDLLRRRVLSAA